eukprot:Em0011g235a
MSERELNPLASEKPFSFLSLKPCDLSKCDRRQIKEYFENTYRLDEGLYSAVIHAHDVYKCPDRLRLPLIFYMGHTASLYVNKLLLAGLITKRVHRTFEAMFETGVDEMSWDDTENYRLGGAYKWPDLEDVLEYRKQVHDLVINVIDSAAPELPVTVDSPWWSVFMGMEHERIHLETSSVLLRQLPVTMLKRPLNWHYGPKCADTPAGPNELIFVPEGEVTLGKPENFPSYGWDNEYGSVNLKVPEFEGSKYLITNREFLGFVQAGAYSRQDLWTKEGWEWVQFRQAQHPTFWVCSNGCKSGCGSALSTYSHCTLPADELTAQEPYKYRAIFDVLDMPWDWPVDVNYHEAKAFCMWKGPEYRLPTEAEHHRMRGDEPLSRNVSCDPIFKEDYPANINLKYGSSTPVNLFPPTSLGFYDMYGNVWEWVEDQFNGLPGFKTTYFYNDFSTPCFDGRHTMIMGGSWISTGDEASRFARFSFRRHFFQHLGFRLVRSSKDTPVRLCKAEVFIPGAGVIDNPVTVPRMNPAFSLVESTNTQFQYETQEKLTGQLEREYGQPDYDNILEVVREKAAMTCAAEKDVSALVFGCGTGRSSFLLTTMCDKVVGIDYCGSLH